MICILKRDKNCMQNFIYFEYGLNPPDPIDHLISGEEAHMTHPIMHFIIWQKITSIAFVCMILMIITRQKAILRDSHLTLYLEGRGKNSITFVLILGVSYNKQTLKLSKLSYHLNNKTFQDLKLRDNSMLPSSR